MERKIDELGRLVIPIEYRRQLGWAEKDEIEMIVTNDTIVLKKPVLGCHFCGSAANLVRIGNKAICRSCGERAYKAKDDEVLYPIRVE
jgi:transcriptional pleiotropic regulator of transition state genes